MAETSEIAISMLIVGAALSMLLMGMLISYYGSSKTRSVGFVFLIIGAALAHVIADLVAALIDPSMRARTAGIVLGGLLPLLLIPVLEKYVTKSKSHIMVGDHEDIEKDLRDEHHH